MTNLGLRALPFLASAKRSARVREFHAITKIDFVKIIFRDQEFFSKNSWFFRCWKFAKFSSWKIFKKKNLEKKFFVKKKIYFFIFFSVQNCVHKVCTIVYNVCTQVCTHIFPPKVGERGGDQLVRKNRHEIHSRFIVTRNFLGIDPEIAKKGHFWTPPAIIYIAMVVLLRTW